MTKNRDKIGNHDIEKKKTCDFFSISPTPTPHSTTGVSPELLHHCKMRTKLNIFPVGPKSDKCAQVKDTVRNKQLKSKMYTDKRRGAKHHTFKPED